MKAAFDVKIENSKLIALRDVSHGWSYELIELKGKLAVIDYEICSYEYIHLFVLEQTRKEEEWKSYTIQFPSTWKNIQQEVIPDVRLSCTFCDGEILSLRI
ncbi:hypothetical protein RDI58_000520 [Solanum bulbocastanum]|uniref:F-box associated beta-propeller type 3 domain-containing protein n=1 Tax=Solanum bulbocastanum TaxID=147425 RepID=A0AAN8UCC4_SOLBU